MKALEFQGNSLRFTYKAAHALHAWAGQYEGRRVFVNQDLDLPDHFCVTLFERNPSYRGGHMLCKPLVTVELSDVQWLIDEVAKMSPGHSFTVSS